MRVSSLRQNWKKEIMSYFSIPDLFTGESENHGFRIGPVFDINELQVIRVLYFSNLDACYVVGQVDLPARGDDPGEIF